MAASEPWDGPNRAIHGRGEPRYDSSVNSRRRPLGDADGIVLPGETRIVHPTVILLVDDEKIVLDSLRAQLEPLIPAGFECETAESAAEGWEVLLDLHARGVRVVVVVSDWLMPGQRGDEFLAGIRDRFPGIGRVMLTGHADLLALERARSTAAAHHILFKPWRSTELRAAIADATVR